VGKLGDALRQRFKTPQEAARALGLDEKLLSRENLMAKAPSKFADFAMQLTARALQPVLAKDAKIDLMPIFKDLTSKTFKAKTVKMALDSALKGKLAADADPTMGHVAQMLDHIEHVGSEGRDESVSEEQHKAMAAAAGGNSNLGIPKKVGEEFMDADKKGFDEEKVEGFKEFLRGKGMSEDDIMGACDALGMGAARMPGMDEETDEEKKAREEKEKKEAEDKKMADDRKRMADDKAAADKAAADKAAADKRMGKDKHMADDKVSKHAMDEAIKVACATTAKNVRATERAIRLALDEVKPFVGEMKPDMAFDSATDVYRQALVMREVDGADKMHADALRPVLMNLPKIGAEHRQASSPALGMDENAVTDVHKMFPGLDRIGTA
jgi:hypothetical protein